MITMIVNKLTSFSETDDSDAYFVEVITHVPAIFNSILFDLLDDPNKNCHSRKLITLKSRNIVSVVLRHTQLTRFLWETLDREESQLLFINII